MSNPPTVLIIEDDPVFRRVVSFTVAKAGLAVETACNGSTGFDRLMQGGIDFLVTDYQMPICTGLELLERLSEIKDYQRPGTILCTAKGLELDSADMMKRFGLIAIMNKPFSPRTLSELIVESLELIDSPASRSGLSPKPLVVNPDAFTILQNPARDAGAP